MRYSDYAKKATQLDKGIEKCLRVELESSEGRGPLWSRLFPSVRRSRAEKARNKRMELAQERSRLDRDSFRNSSLIENLDVDSVFWRNVPASAEAIERLRDVADAALETNRKEAWEQ